MKKTTRRILSLTIAILMLLVTILPGSAIDLTFTPIVQTPAALTRILSAHPELSVASSQPLYSPTNEIAAYYYTFSPTGYAIVSVQGEVVEWSPTATREIPTNQTVYYAGPLSYFTKSGVSYVDVYSGEAYRAAVIAARYAEFESTAQAYAAPTDIAPAAITPPPETPITTLSGSTAELPAAYRHHGTECGCGYTRVCGTVAVCILIKYYNDYICPGIVPSWGPDPNDSGSFIHYMLTYTQPQYTDPDYDDTSNDARGAYSSELASGINAFWGVHNRIDAYNGYSATYGTFSYSNYKNIISDERPCILLLQDHYTYHNHFVVGYGWYEEYFSGVLGSTFCTVADGWGAVGVHISTSYITQTVSISE